MKATKQVRKFKLRSAWDDCLPTSVEEWNALSPLVEQAYRRGFYQGVAFFLQWLEQGVTVREIESHMYRKLHPWRYARYMRYSYPPEPRPKYRKWDGCHA